MRSRGFTLIEVIVALVAASIVLLGSWTFYLSALHFSADSERQAYLQRQATVVLEQFGRQIRPASSLTILNGASPGTCMDPIAADLTPGTDVLVVDNGTVFCFYRSAANQMIRCQYDNTSNTCNSWNLLSGGLAPLTVSSFVPTLLTQCDAAGSTCAAGVCSNPSYSCASSPAAMINFTLRYTPKDRPGETLELAFGDMLTTGRQQ
jgi:prepilin-type N-terminal cleavage/methylation domain-containing protein